MSKHTPGPWEPGEEAGIWAGKRKICVMRYFLNKSNPLKICEKETQANARLIAAAPELLEACKNLIYSFNTMDAKDISVSIKMGKQAITKAEGKET